MAKIVIIGNGISGITTARHVRKRSDDEIVVISSESKYHFSRTALMYIYMGHMKQSHTQPYSAEFWEKNRISLVYDHVDSVDYQNKKLVMAKGDAIVYDKLVLAVGSKPNKFGWPGQDLLGVQGLYSLQDLNKLQDMSSTIEHGVIIGGGLIGIELAEMLLSRGKKVTFLVREKYFWQNVLPIQESVLIEKHIRSHHVDLRMESELDEIISDEKGWAKAIRTKSGEVIDCQFVGLTAGVSPNIDFLRGSDLELGRGILINQFFETNIPDVFAIGDCAQFSEPIKGRRPIEQVWYTGKMMGEALAKTLTGSKTKYQPGPWFNSAKFFDIEYQTYGTVLSTLQEGEKDFYWEAEDNQKCIHIVWDEETGVFIGLNTFGIRLRHEFFKDYIEKKRTVTDVLEHLEDAHFDPEFYKNYFPQVLDKFNREQGTNLQLKKKSWKRILEFINY